MSDPEAEPSTSPRSLEPEQDPEPPSRADDDREEDGDQAQVQPEIQLNGKEAVESLPEPIEKDHEAVSSRFSEALDDVPLDNDTPHEHQPAVVVVDAAAAATTEPFPAVKQESNQSSTQNLATPGSNGSATPPVKRRLSKRSPSIALSVSSTSSGHQTVSSMVFVKNALDAIAASKDARKISSLDTAVKKATQQLSEMTPHTLPRPLVIFQPLQIVCQQSSNNDLKSIALDCIAKLFSFSFLEEPESIPEDPSSGVTPPPSVPLIDRAVNTVCDTYRKDNTDHKVEMQIVKALSAAVLNEDLVIHEKTLLTAIRQTYTIFVTSTSNNNQTVAQASLTQMVNVVFERIKKTAVVKSGASSTVNVPSTPKINGGGSETPVPVGEASTELTLEEMENRGEQRTLEDDTKEFTNDVSVKDAFLVFRTLCKLSGKKMDEGDTDTKSHFMRSKLLSLHLIHTILKSHMTVFLSTNVVIQSNTKGEETFVMAVRDYVCASLARNAISISPPVFEISAEIFWLIFSNLRQAFKKHLEVFLAQYLDIMEMPTTPSHLKQFYLTIVQKVNNDPRALVELFLNYDCDKNSSINAYERTIDMLVRIAVTPVHVTPMQLQHYRESRHQPIAVYNLSLPPALSIASVAINSHAPDQPLYPVQYALKMSALDALVAVLRSLVSWSQRSGLNGHGNANGAFQPQGSITPQNESKHGEVLGGQNQSDTSLTDGQSSSTTTADTLVPDDPTQFAALKRRKADLHEAIEEFNFKPKRGIKHLIKSGFIESEDPAVVATFLLGNEDIDKASLGDFLGENDQFNLEVMHAFINSLDFTAIGFVDSIRTMLQTFRLPGEAQKIDRIMLKFAERYVTQNPGMFKSADGAYVLAYSVILLNTDLHSPQIKKGRMTPDDFLRNNRGINDESDLPREFLLKIYEEIQGNEIKLKSEQQAALMATDGKQQQGLTSFIRRDNTREAYLLASRELSNKAERLFQSMVDSRRESSVTLNESGTAPQTLQFFVASHVNHVKPMFQVAWMSFLAGLSGPFQESDEPEVVKLCLDGFRSAIRLACWIPTGGEWDSQEKNYARESFINALEKFTNLQALGEIKMKNVEALKVLMEIALTEGDMLEESWRNILTSFSHLQRLQLIISGIDSKSIPDVSTAKIARPSVDSRRSTSTFRASTNGSAAAAAAAATRARINTPFFSSEVRAALIDSEMTHSMDRVFSQTAKLSGDAVVYFVKALSQVSLEEVQSSGNHLQPRTDALSKMVDVCYYNMGRIRVEWSHLWNTMGEQFNNLGCHSNERVVQFALDALRQLSLRFLEIEELPHFKFQKDFLQPFEHVMKYNDNVNAKEMVLDCLDQMIQARSPNIKSGWARMFQVFSAASESNPKTVGHAFKIVKNIYDHHLPEIMAQGSFGDLVGCLGAIAKNPRDQKVALQSIELLRRVIPQIHEISGAFEDEIKARGSMWYAILQAFQSVIIQSRDLEVRSRALNYLFDSLTEYGGTFDVDTWDSVCQNLLFPIFDMLGKQPQDEQAVWLNTTMVQALRNMIALLTHYFDTLERMLGGFLDLLVRCIDQDNDTVSKIGSSCLSQLVTKNVSKLERHHWTEIVDKIALLFENTTANEVFTIAPRGPNDDHYEIDASADEPPPTSSSSRPRLHDRQGSIVSVGLEALNDTTTTTTTNGSVSNEDRQRLFRPTIIKSILQRLMISTVNELVENAVVFAAMPTSELLRIAHMLRDSYMFSRKFNNDRELRMRIWKQRFMHDMPNLLTQESISALTYVKLMMDLYMASDKPNTTAEDRAQIEAELVPQCIDILQDYNAVAASQKRYIQTLWPVILEILTRYAQFSEPQMRATIAQMYPHIVRLLNKDIVPEVRDQLRLLLTAIGNLFLE